LKWSIYGIKQLKSCLLWLLSARTLQQTVNVKKEIVSGFFNKFTVTVITTTPEAQVVYTIAALKTVAPEQK